MMDARPAGSAVQGSGPLRASLDLRIEEMVLDGLAGVDRAEIGLVVQRELTRLFAEEGVPPWLARGGEVAGLDGGEFSVEPGMGTLAIGAQIARAIYGGLDR